ncbi:MAG: hypothetical protein EAX90_01925 [Candidatus Heimdallarchaeota archaeon]|nr:hypothetical protein [Candidatus Heimdallarchaeota archaeon]
MNIRSKKLLTIAIIVLVLPLVSLATVQQHEVAAAAPTVSITEVTSTKLFRLEVTAEISLPGANYDFYVQELRLYLNKSVDTIIADDYENWNGSNLFTYERGEEFTYTIKNYNPLEEGFYNITLVAITSTDEYSDLVQWTGGHYFIDRTNPKITFINPAIGYEEIWGNYTIDVKIEDYSNLSLIRFLVDGKEKYVIDEPTPGQTAFSWDYECYKEAGKEPLVTVEAYDASDAENFEDNATSVTVVGPKLTYLEPMPSYIDTNDTLAFNVSVVDTNDPQNNMSLVELQYQIDNNPWQAVAFNNDTFDIFWYNLTNDKFSTVGTKISWRIFANNTLGQYHIFKNETYQPFTIYSTFPDHINPIGEVIYESKVDYGDPITVALNVTEQSLISLCKLNYQVKDSGWTQYINDEWEEVQLLNISAGPPGNTTWVYFEFNFTETYPVFTQIDFYFWLNDSGNNKLLKDNGGNYYNIKIMPNDLIAPIVNITAIPETIKTGQNITITVTVEDESNITSVQLIYVLKGVQNIFEMDYVSGDIWTISFIISGSTGDEVEIFVRAIDQYYNTGESTKENFTIESEKSIGTHSNAWLWLILIALSIIPIALTLILLKPQK